MVAGSTPFIPSSIMADQQDYVFMQYILIPEMWIYNYFVPAARLDEVVSEAEMKQWVAMEPMDELQERLAGKVWVLRTKYDDGSSRMPDLPAGVRVVRYAVNIETSM